jgi:CBS domain containing-hemolysin-like protein
MENETGACEALSSDLATHEEIMDKAYAYAYRLQIGQFYQPPVTFFEYMLHTCTCILHKRIIKRT